MQMVMVYCQSDTDRGDPKKSEISMFRCHFVNHKSHMERPMNEDLIYGADSR